MVKIELSPYDALGILCFLREYFNDANRDVQEYSAMHETVDAYEKQIYENTTADQVDEALLELQVNNITQRIPPPYPPG